jgi:hypothetical protein
MKLNATFFGFIVARNDIKAEMQESEPTFGIGIDS